jgi:S-formylglutathione hydrolase FrmB
VRCRINELIDSVKTVMNIRDFIYVLPDAGNSYFINNSDSSNRIADYLAGELVPAIDSLYRTRPGPGFRGILGLSMGGYGAIIHAIKPPRQFGTAVALSASVRTASQIMALPQDRYEKLFGDVYGHGLPDTARITKHWREYSPYDLIDTSTVKELSTINWYIDCGMNDFLLPASEAFHELLMKYNIPHEFHVRPGKHNWAYWYKSTVFGLLYLNEKLKD